MAYEIESIISKLKKELVTTERTHAFLNAMDVMLEKEFDEQMSNEAIMEQFIPLLPIKDSLEAIFSEIISSKDKASFFKVIKDIYTELKESSVINVTFALIPTLNFLKEIYPSIIEFTGEEALLDVIEDPAIVTGLIIINKGVYHDLSFNKMSEDYFKNNIPAIIQNNTVEINNEQ